MSPRRPHISVSVSDWCRNSDQNNPQIKGISIEENEFKITQFADDTTLILDGSQQSLQSALNTLEIYGNYSGLKKKKTKVIYIGRKNTQNKNYMLQWNWYGVQLISLY